MPQIDSSKCSGLVGVAVVLVAALLGACAQTGGPAPAAAPKPAGAAQPQANPEAAMAEAAAAVEKKPDPMADVAGDKALPPLRGAAERLECASGGADQHRIGLEARGGQVTYFTYYNKWQLRTCSLELSRDAAGSKWRLAADGATRVQTPHGVVLIHARKDAYVFDFQRVARRPFCGTPGEITGTMTVNRGAGKRVCATTGFANTGAP